MATRYISIRQIADDIMDHPMLKDLTLERIVDYAVKFIEIMGMPQEFMEKVETLEVHDYRAQLPCDYYDIIQLRTTHGHHTFISSTNSFHYGRDQHMPTLTYKIQDNMIYTSIPEGKIDLSYLAFTVDGDGFPMIPEDSTFTEALELYIKKKKFTVLFDKGEINSQVLHNTQQEYYSAKRLCKARFNTPSYDEMEAIANMWGRLLPATHMHQSGFIDANLRERRKF